VVDQAEAGGGKREASAREASARVSRVSRLIPSRKKFSRGERGSEMVDDHLFIRLSVLGEGIGSGVSAVVGEGPGGVRARIFGTGNVRWEGAP